MKISPLLKTDFYKIYHWAQYNPLTEYVYSNTTARKSRLEGVNEIVVFGLRYFVEEYLINDWKENFFNRPVDEVITEYRRIIDRTIGPHTVNEEQLKYLHSLGYLPLKLKALSEGTLCPIGIPCVTIINTDPECYWLTNFVETISQTVLWQPITSATIAHRYKLLLDQFAEETSDTPEFVQWQAHDFSMRGMSSFESCCVSGAGHLLSFTGTDSIPAICILEAYYGADVTKELIGASVTASEHSVQCSHYDGSDNEDLYIARMLEIQKEGIVSVVADGIDYWKFISQNLITFKDQIMARNGKFVVRPDTGDPVKIVTGYFIKDVYYTSDQYIKNINRKSFFIDTWCDQRFDAVKTTDNKYFDIHGTELSEEEVKGSIQVLYEIFGGIKNDKGYIELDPHIGLIYGDSITYDRANLICELLANKGFASTNIVFGIGSFQYQFVTRDTYSIAFKATYVQINDEAKPIFKDPKTGDGMKKSAKGLLRVNKVNGTLVLKDQCTPEEEAGGELQVIFENGIQYNTQTLSQIRERLNG